MKDSVRLNQEIRSYLRRAVLRHKFQKEADEVFEERRRIALWVYNLYFDEETRAQFAALPEGWLQNSDAINFHAGGRSYYYRFDGKVFWNRLMSSIAYEAVKCEFDHRKFRTPNSFENKHFTNKELVLAVQKVEQRQEKMEEAIREAHGKVHRMLNSYKTIRTLKEAWPEIAPFIPAEHEPKKVESARLPAVQPAVLNAMLDLPV